jgi:4-amino-4-deoxy-L-arabinose transferase-like glycosyltransferase
VGAAAVSRATLAWTNQGVIHPDEIFQSVEQAHRWIFGFGFRPWEFRAGARSWLMPGMLGIAMKIGSAFGASSGVAVARVAKLTMVAFSSAAVAGATLLSFELGGAEACLLTAALMATSPQLVLMGARAFSEVASAPFLVFGLWALLKRRPQAFLAGALLGFAAALRIHNGVMAAVVFAGLLVGRRFRDALQLALGGAAVTLASGALDWITWGEPFHALTHYLAFNTNMSRWASDRAREPGPIYFASTAWKMFGPPIALLIPAAIWGGVKRSPLVLAVAVAFVLFHGAIPHKEARFLVPAEPLVWVLAGVGLALVLRRFQGLDVRAAALGLAVLLTAWNGYRASELTFDDIGTFVGERRGQRSVWSMSDDIDRLLSAAGQRPDVCGVAVDDIIWYGGFTYLHRNVPLLWGAGQREQLSANYIVEPQSARIQQGYQQVEALGTYGLYRREGDCLTYAGYTTDMPGI